MASERAIAAVRAGGKVEAGPTGRRVRLRVGDAAPGVPGAGEIAVSEERVEQMRGYLEAIDAAEPGTPERTRAERAFERDARELGLLGEKQDFASDKAPELERARASERQADAVRAANWLIQNQADQRRVDLGYLRKIGVVKGEYAGADRSALAGDIAGAIRRYTAQPEGGKGESGAGGAK
jgi:hypothetical protein